ncbi:hypothetical protein WN51_06240 [Melipona quadrifasciata]|uniref:Reticulocyte-binding protein 2 like protein a n=1 Tax=Melipona quadrifasciata TaxID=166423 RepID=A0A0N0BCD5_9HYME|nr:hypothetical protein WN51_06240 [Melipona quadrifasciata]
MQPGATVVLATVWLAVYANLVGTLRINFTADQYSPLAPQHQRHEVYRRAEGQPSLWKDSNSGSQGRSHESTLLARRSRDSAADDFSSLAEDKRRGGESTDEKTDNRGTNGALESSQRELSPPAEFEDPFVADDTFQDQGPGSVEIYKLDVFRVNSLLRPSSPRFPLPSKNKSKAPKKTSQASWNTEVPPANTDGSFGIGGVPELQVGCEGLEAAESDHGRERRSIDSGDKNLKREVDSSWVDVTPISLNLDYELSGEEGYEEMDELLKLKKLESTTKRSRQNRGDMDATLHSVFHDGKHKAEKLPVRGDLGKSSASNESSVERQSNRQVEEKTRLADEALRLNEGKRDDYPGVARSDDGTSAGNQRRKILWLEDPDVEQQLKGNEERRKRDTWGFGEDEGVVSSDELQTENQRRRLAYERQNMIRQEELRRREEQRRRAEEALRRNQIENRTNSDIERIREEYDRKLSEREREEEERRRQLQQSNRWQLDEEHRRRLQEEVSRRNRLEGQRRAQELESLRRRETVIQRSASEEERKRQWQQAIEMRRPEEDRLKEMDARQRFREEEARKWNEELRRRQQEQDRRSLEERRREWMLKRRQEEEEERRRHQQSRNEPSNLLHPSRSSPNSDKSYDQETERRLREQQERERQRKLNEYVQRNRPIKVNSSIDREREEANERRQQEERRRAEEQRQRLEAERKLQDYVRRNQPVRVSKLNESYDENWLEYRRRLDEARQRNQSRYTGPGSGRRNHGPSAPTNIDPRYYVDDARREAARRIEEEERIRERQRQQEQQEQLRRYALRREEEARRMQSRRYEEERKRQEAVRLEAEKRAKELQEEEARRSQAGRRPLENTRPSYENRRRFDYGRRQDTSLIPTNLVLNESRRAAERQRQEQERRRAEAEKQRAREAREKEERDRVMKEHRRRQEEARLNALPVSASIIVKPATPNLSSRINFNTLRLNPYEDGIKVSNFPAPPTQRPPVKSPPPCVWAVVHCCPSKVNRLVTCFESMGCPGINWDPSPCRTSIMQAAKNRVAKFYEETEDKDEYDYS